MTALLLVCSCCSTEYYSLSVVDQSLEANDPSETYDNGHHRPNDKIESIVDRLPHALYRHVRTKLYHHHESCIVDVEHSEQWSCPKLFVFRDIQDSILKDVLLCVAAHGKGKHYVN